MAMALKLYLCLTLLSLPPATSSYHHPHGNIASAPSSFSQSGHGSSNLQSFSSFLWQKILHGSRKLQTVSSRGRLAAEVGNITDTSTRAPAQAPAPAPSSGGNGKLGKKESTSTVVKWLAGIALGSVTGAISALIASLLLGVIRGYAKRPKAGKPVVFQRKIVDAKALAFLEKAVAMESLELLGKGGSGEVYKTNLENGTAVAIKKVLGLSVSPNGGGVDPDLEQSYDLTKNSKQIHAELTTLGQIRHRNLVTLLAYIPQPSAHLLIYEYIENGSLHDVLMEVAQNKLELPWKKRLAIAKDVATGLKYLHLDCIPKIIHCDLKPGNILLDKDMVAHIGDFGLAKVIPDKHTHITGNNVAGTVGYIAPEYYQSLRYNTQGDVYAFGVVLIVLVTGKEPTSPLFVEVNTHMGNWIANILAAGDESAKSILDERLRGHGDEEEEMLLVLKVAAFCLLEDPRARPNADDILKMLNQIRSSQQEKLHPELDQLIVDAQ
ncbi:hypothetical protein GOP47_0014126 [Adiantum capillus-veneris]|uniref:Protein kinase domain-containing protein n=1 Tax=Adiantum capillus-veneris TaxID=13818 RepID=A0A9D4ZG25_ADICA|nr:hypothetical protein GOP47_0014126 [Adiantum capillus-veneris]